MLAITLAVGFWCTQVSQGDQDIIGVLFRGTFPESLANPLCDFTRHQFEAQGSQLRFEKSDILVFNSFTGDSGLRFRWQPAFWNHAIFLRFQVGAIPYGKRWASRIPARQVKEPPVSYWQVVRQVW